MRWKSYSRKVLGRWPVAVDRLKSAYALFLALFCASAYPWHVGFAGTKHTAFACIDIRLTEDFKGIEIDGLSIELPDGYCDASAANYSPSSHSYYKFKILDAKKQTVDVKEVYLSTKPVPAADAKNVKLMSDTERTIKLGLGDKRPRPITFQATDPSGKILVEKDFLSIFADDFLEEHSINVFQPSLKFKDLSIEYHSGKKKPRQVLTQILEQLKDCKTAVLADKYRGSCEAIKRYGKYALENL